MILASEGSSIYWQLTRILLHQTLPAVPPSTTDSNLRSVAALLLMRMHVSKSESVSIYCSRIHVGNSSKGLS